MAKVGTYALAASTFDRAALMDPSNAWVRQQRGVCKCWLGDTAGAIQDLTDAIQMGLDNADPYFHRGSTYICMGDMPAALADLDQAVAKEKRNPRVLTRRAALHGQMGNYKKAIADFGAADAIAPLDALDRRHMQLFADVASGKINATGVTNQNVDLTRAKRMMKMQDYAGAVPALERALKRGWDDAQVLFWLGFCKWHLEQHIQACADLDKALELKPDYAECLEVRGEVKFVMEDFEGALADACAAQHHAEVAEQVLPAALWVHGAALHELGQDAAALPVLDKAEIVTPEQQIARVLLLRGMVKAMLADWRGAVEDFDKVQERGEWIFTDDAVALSHTLMHAFAKQKLESE